MNWQPVTQRAHDPNATPIEALEFDLSPREREDAAFNMALIRERIRQQNIRDAKRGAK